MMTRSESHVWLCCHVRGSGRTGRGQETMTDRMSLIVFSGTIDKLLAALHLGCRRRRDGYASPDILTNWALLAFRKDDCKTELRVSKDFEEYGPILREQLLNGKLPSWLDNLQGRKRSATCTLRLQHDDGPVQSQHSRTWSQSSTARSASRRLSNKPNKVASPCSSDTQAWK